MSTLASLLAGIQPVPATLKTTISGISHDSRKITPGDCFIAYPGSDVDGRVYINEALEKGAVAVIAEQQDFSSVASIKEEVPCLLVNALQQHVGAIAANFYHHPSERLFVVGVTGTNGKTSVAHYLADVIHRLRPPCAVLGTVGGGLPGALHSAVLTTSDAIALQQGFSDFLAQGVCQVVMEVSSHALVQGRVKATAFDIGVLTNLSQDHLDYHGSMAAYGSAKQRLFTDYGLRHAVINTDDAFGRKVMGALPATVQGVSYAVNDTRADVLAEAIHVSPEGIKAKVRTPWGEGLLESRHLGGFTVYNLLASVAVLGVMGFSLEALLNALRDVASVPGRMQTLRYPNKPLVVVDYAHTPDALANVLTSLRQNKQGQLICVFGCGGGRDSGKRPQMGSIAERLADRVIVTNDNPRHEPPQAIIDDILSGMARPEKVTVIADRRQAIQQAILWADSQDIVLLAGKGHERYQLMGDATMPFDDVVVAKEYLKN